MRLTGFFIIKYLFIFQQFQVVAATTSSFTFRVGTGAATCPSTQEFCDGPLQPGTQYR